MNTRLTGRGLHAAAPRWSQAAISAFSQPASTTLPSTPAVLRPALTSVTRRTLTSAPERDRSISFCRLRTFFRSPALLAVKIRCRSRRTLSSAWRQSTASQSTTSPSGPFTVTVPNLPIGSGISVHLIIHRLTRPTSAPFRAGHLPVSGQLCGKPPAEVPARGSRFPAAFRLPAFASWVILRPLGNSASLTVGPPAQDPPDPNGVVVLHMSKTRPGRAPPLPRGRWCAPARRLSSGRHLPLFRGQSLQPRWNIPPAGLTFTRRQQGFTCVRPSPAGGRVPPTSQEAAASRRSSPRLRPPDGTGAASASSPGSAPRSYPRRTPGRRQAITHWPGYYTLDISRTSKRCLPLDSSTLTPHPAVRRLKHHLRALPGLRALPAQLRRAVGEIPWVRPGLLARGPESDCAAQGMASTPSGHPAAARIINPPIASSCHW